MRFPLPVLTSSKIFLAGMLGLLFFVFSTITSVAQDTIAHKKLILLAHKYKEKKPRHFKEGKRVVVWLENGEEKLSGKLDILNDSTILINDSTVFVSDMTQIRGRSTGLLAAKIFGTLLAGTGATISTFGISFIVAGLNANNLAGVIVFAAGFVMTAAGLAALIVGLVPLLLRGKKYDLHKDWDIKIIEPLDFIK